MGEAAAAAAAAVAVGGGGPGRNAAGTTPTTPPFGDGRQRDDTFGYELGYVWPADLSSRGVAADGTVHESLPAVQVYSQPRIHHCDISFFYFYLNE